jgi:hypothetical protein
MSTISLVLLLKSNSFFYSVIVKTNFIVSPFNWDVRLSTADIVLPNSILVEVKFVCVVSKRSEVAKSFNFLLNKFYNLKKYTYHLGLFSDYLRLLLVRD